MNVNRRWLYGGVFFIALGAVLLAGPGDAVDGDASPRRVRLWPVLVIALGVGLLLRRTRFDVAGGMIAAVVPGLVLGGMLVAAPVAVAAGPPRVRRRPADEPRVARGLVRRRRVGGPEASLWRRHRHDRQRQHLALDAGNGSGTARRGRRDRGPPLGRLGVRRAAVRVRAWQRRLAAHAARRRAGSTLPRRSKRVGVGSTSRAPSSGRSSSSSTRAKRTQTSRRRPLERLTAHVNGGAASLRLPADDFAADLAVNAGALRICAPSDLGLRIRSDGTLTATTYDGLVRDDNAWESPGYATAIHHADVTISANVASVDVNPMGGCK